MHTEPGIHYIVPFFSSTVTDFKQVITSTFEADEAVIARFADTGGGRELDGAEEARVDFPNLYRTVEYTGPTAQAASMRLCDPPRAGGGIAIEGVWTWR